MKSPDFLVAGAARCGTTALHYYLKQHPQIFLPSQKEPCFYCFAGEKIDYKQGRFTFVITDHKRYSELFKSAKQEQTTGEISTPYIYLHHRTIQNIKKFHSSPADLKIIIILRDPIDRAYSQYLWKVRDGREKLSFEEALKQEKNRMEENYSFDYFYAHRGLYYEQVKDYLENFNKVKIFLYEDFKMHFDKTMESMCEFLKVDRSFQFTKREDMNRSAFPRFGTLGKIITVESKIKFRMLNYLPEEFRLGIKERFNRWNSSKNFPVPVSAATRAYLQEYYKEDILKLAKMTGLHLSSWLKPVL
jgi:hypothetical protein